jgi:MerR family transcriptional regulator, redox-sensitive transcriptional activator SoxR
MLQDSLTIGEVASLVGLHTSTLRYYEQMSILPQPKRVNGHRRYSPDILVVLAVIQLAKDSNFSLAEIKDLLYGTEGKPSERWQQLAQKKLHEINAIISRAQEMKHLLEETLESDALHFELDESLEKLRTDT